MKKILLGLAIGGITLLSCKKTDAVTEGETITSQAKSNEVSNVQDTKTFKSSKGDILKVTYYAEGADVMVKIQKNSESEQKLSAKTVNQKGNAIFTNDNYMWEMKEGNLGGKLSDKDGNAMEYSEETAQ